MGRICYAAYATISIEGGERRIKYGGFRRHHTEQKERKTENKRYNFRKLIKKYKCPIMSPYVF